MYDSTNDLINRLRDANADIPNLRTRLQEQIVESDAIGERLDALAEQVHAPLYGPLCPKHGDPRDTSIMEPERSRCSARIDAMLDRWEREGIPGVIELVR